MKQKNIRQKPKRGADPNTVDAWLYADAFKVTINKIVRSFKKHIDATLKKHPGAHILTHTYDIFEPNKKGARILFDLIPLTGPWVSIGMKDISPNVRVKIVRRIMETMRDKLKSKLSKKYPQFHVVDTIGTLKTGSKRDWTDEIHPTPSGFKKIALKVYAKMRSIDKSLPKGR